MAFRLETMTNSGKYISDNKLEKKKTTTTTRIKNIHLEYGLKLKMIGHRQEL